MNYAKHHDFRIPYINLANLTIEEATQWAIAMCEAGLDYHMDEDPHDIYHLTNNKLGEPLFNYAECIALRLIVHSINQLEGFCIHEVMIDWYNDIHTRSTVCFEPYPIVQ